MNEDEILTPKEVSQWLKTCKSWPYVAASRGLLPYLKLGTTDRKKLIRFKRSDIEEFLQKAKVK